MRGHSLALIGICLLTFFAGLGNPAITDSDEAFYAESAREMVESGDWLTPHFNYTYRFEKPVLYYWLAAAAYTVTGVGEAAARFPSALSGLGLVLLAAACARRWYDHETGLLAGVITATSFGYVAMSRQALPDLLLAFFISLSTWAALVAWLSPPSGSTPAPGDRARRWWVVVAAIGAAGGLLTKGPIGIALPAVVVAPLIAWEYRWGHAKLVLRPSDLVLGLAVLMVLGGPWYLGMTLEHGVAYLDRFFVGENLDRFATDRYNDPRPLWYYLPIVLSGLLPWSPFMLLWVPALRRVTRAGLTGAVSATRLVWWALAPLIFYTVSIGKQPRYILPVLPPLAVLLAVAIRRQLSAHLDTRLFSFCAGLSGLALVAVGGLVYRARPLFIEWDGAWISLAALAIALAGVGVLVAISEPKWVPRALVGASIAVALSAHYVVLASPAVAPVERMAEMLLEANGGDQRSSRYNIFNRNLIFYTRVPFEELNAPQAARDFLGSSTPVFLVLPAEDIPRIEALGVTVRRLGDVRYLNTGSFTVRMLIDPDPERYLRRAVLVTNK